MPRKTRMYLPDIPVHVVQRGNNRGACFFCEAVSAKADVHCVIALWDHDVAEK